MSALQKKIDAFYTAIKAEALIVALDWAGSPELLARFAGMKPQTGRIWLLRKAIPVGAAHILAKVPGFPLSRSEMRPDCDFSEFIRRKCNHCDRLLYPPRQRSGCRLPRRDSPKLKQLLVDRDAQLDKIAATGSGKRTSAERASANRLGTERRAARLAEYESRIVCTPDRGVIYKTSKPKKPTGYPPGRPKKDAPPRPPKVPGKPGRKPMHADLI